MWWWIGTAAASICTPDASTCWGSIGEALATTTGPLSLVLTEGAYAEPAVVVPPGRSLDVTGSGVVVLSAPSGSLFQVGGSLVLRSLTLASAGDSVVKVVDGSLEVRSCVLLTLGLAGNGGILFQQGGSLTVADSTFLDSLSFGDGGQVFARDAVVDVQRSTFTGGVARSGGAMALEASGPTPVSVSDCRFESATAVADGGAISVSGPVALQVRDSLFLDDRAARGGAISVADDASLLIEGSRFEADEGTLAGGALWSSSGTIEVDVTAFVGNRSAAGGALAVDDGTTTLTRALLCRNEADEGGAAWFGVGSHEVRNSRFFLNAATDHGGGLHVAGGQVDLLFDDLVSNRAPAGSVLSLEASGPTAPEVGMQYDLVAWNTDSAVFDGLGVVEQRNLVYGNAGLAIGLDPTDLRTDPSLVAYDASADCDALLTTYSYYGPMRDPFPDDALLTDMDPDGSLPDIGSYGGPGAERAAWEDEDSDGAPALFDCDEQNPLIRPYTDHHNEIWYDGIDQDCDGRDTDQDGDGFELPLDCDDQDAGRYPGVKELVGMGDMDCDGFADADHDGYSPPEDCADADPRIHPGAAEDADPLVDRDCDGIGDPIGPLVRRSCADGRASAGPSVGWLVLAAWRRARRRGGP